MSHADWGTLGFRAVDPAIAEAVVAAYAEAVLATTDLMPKDQALLRGTLSVRSSSTTAGQVLEIRSGFTGEQYQTEWDGTGQDAVALASVAGSLAAESLDYERYLWREHGIRSEK